MVLFGNNFANAKNRLPLGCSAPIIPIPENPEVDKCKKGNDLIEFAVKSVIKSEEISLFDPSEMTPFIDKLEKISKESSNKSTDIKDFQKNLLNDFA